MSNPLVLSNDDGIRPAGNPDQCFYCKQKVGTPHKDGCVILNRKVKVKYSYEIEIEVPHGWSKDDIEFHRNESSWCADSSLRELSEISNNETIGCLCNVFECEVLEIPEAKPYRYDDEGNIVD